MIIKVFLNNCISCTPIYFCRFSFYVKKNFIARRSSRWSLFKDKLDTAGIWIPGEFSIQMAEKSSVWECHLNTRPKMNFLGPVLEWHLNIELIVRVFKPQSCPEYQTVSSLLIFRRFRILGILYLDPHCIILKSVLHSNIHRVVKYKNLSFKR